MASELHRPVVSINKVLQRLGPGFTVQVEREGIQRSLLLANDGIQRRCVCHPGQRV